MKKNCRLSGGKRKFTSREQAWVRAGDLLTTLEVRGIPGPRFLRAYKCPHCNQFHLTSK